MKPGLFGLVFELPVSLPARSAPPCPRCGLPLPRQLRQVLLQTQDDHGHQCGISRYDTVGTLREGGNRERGDVYLSQLSSAFLSQTYTNVHFC